MHSFPRPATCRERGQRVSKVDDLVWKEIQNLFEPEYVKDLASKWLKDRPATTPLAMPDTKALKARAELDSREVDCYESHKTSRITDQELILRLNEIKDKRLELDRSEKSKVDEVDQSDINCDELSEAAIKYLSELNGDDKLPIVRNLIEKVVINKMEVKIYGSIKVPINEKVGLNAFPRHRRTSKRWQVHAF